jgi:hypothetical protein
MGTDGRAGVEDVVNLIGANLGLLFETGAGHQGSDLLGHEVGELLFALPMDHAEALSH